MYIFLINVCTPDWARRGSVYSGRQSILRLRPQHDGGSNFLVFLFAWFAIKWASINHIFKIAAPLRANFWSINSTKWTFWTNFCQIEEIHHGGCFGWFFEQFVLWSFDLFWQFFVCFELRYLGALFKAVLSRWLNLILNLEP